LDNYEFEQRIKMNSKTLEAMKLMHYFITDKNYNPIIVQGLDDEIWLENLDGDYKVIRIVSNYIHNDEQYRFNQTQAKRIIKKIKKKTFAFTMDTLNIYLDLGDNVKTIVDPSKHFINIKVNEKKDLNKEEIIDYFPDIITKTNFKETGISLFAKITTDLNMQAKKDSDRLNKLFSSKTPIITYSLMAINIIVFILEVLLGQGTIISNFAVYFPLIKNGEYYRLLTGIFLHANIFHLAFNMYALFVIGKQLENLVGKHKFLIIYLFSGITGALFSILFNQNSISVGASGAIFGLMGSLVYFGYYYRVYFGNVILKEIIPVILLNLVLGFSMSGIDNFAHIGGLIGGCMITSCLGIDDKSKLSDRINGIIITCIFIIFIIYMTFIYVK